MFDKLKQKVQELKISNDASLPVFPEAGKITKRDIYQNRYNFGVNFGSLFVLEKYIYDSLFSAGGENEHDAIVAYAKKTSVNDAAKKLEEHYTNYISDDDWRWLKDEAGITAIRLPVGYWHIGNGQFLEKGMCFEDLQKVYESAKPWDHIKRIVADAKKNEIGVLFDLHALPGGANGDAHSGETNGGKAKFFQNGKAVKKVVEEMLPFVVNDLCQQNENVIGLQIVNEAAFNNSPSAERNYYAKAIRSIRKLDSTLPIVISDGWWPEQWADWLENVKLSNDVVIDSHTYRCFSDEDKSKSARQLTDELHETVNFAKDKADYVVGEFSCVLDGSTWDKTKEPRDECVASYGQKQTQVFQDNASWGWFFWTYKFEHGDGGEWGFVPMVNRGCIPKRPRTDPHIDDNRVKDIVAEHVNYWKDKGGDKFEHWRYEDGIKNAIDDIKAFNAFEHSRVGRRHFMKNVRRHQYTKDKGDSEYMWEWEQGYDKGLDEFNRYK